MRVKTIEKLDHYTELYDDFRYRIDTTAEITNQDN